MSASAMSLDSQLIARILVIEDEPVLAFALEDFLIDAGFVIAGVAGRVETALAVIESGVCDAAIVDANLAGVSASPVALALRARGVPFIVVSGYSPAQLPSAFSEAPFLQKPWRPDRLIQALCGILPVR
jgi:DNA-binding response OmpR family regulator